MLRFASSFLCWVCAFCVAVSGLFFAAMLLPVLGEALSFGYLGVHSGGGHIPKYGGDGGRRSRLNHGITRVLSVRSCSCVGCIVRCVVRVCPTSFWGNFISHVDPRETDRLSDDVVLDCHRG